MRPYQNQIGEKPPKQKLSLAGIFQGLAAKNARVVEAKTQRWSFDFSKGEPNTNEIKKDTSFVWKKIDLTTENSEKCHLKVDVHSEQK